MWGLLFALLAWMPVLASEAMDACAADLPGAEDPRSAYRCLYMAARRDGAWDEARAHLGARVDLPGERGWALLMLAHIASDLGEGGSADAYDRAIAGFQSDGDARGEVYARLGLATWHHYDERFDETFAQLDVAEALAGEVDDPMVQATVRVQQARFLMRTGKVERALALLDLVEPVVFPDGSYQLRLTALYVRVGAEHASGDLARAYVTGSRMMDLAVDEGDLYVAGSVAIGQLLLVMESPDLFGTVSADELRTLALQALDLGEQMGNWKAVMAAKCLMGAVAGPGGGPHFEACLADRRSRAQEGESQLEITALSGLSLTERHAPRALMLADEALAVARAAEDDRMVPMAAYRKAWLLWRQGRESAALEAHLVALDDIEAQRDARWRDLERGGYAGWWTGPYADLAARHALDGDAAGALAVLERHRGRILLEESLRQELLASDPPALRQAHRVAAAGIERAQQALREAAAADVPAAHAALRQAESAELLAREALREARAETAAIDPVQPPTLEAAQAALRDGEALVVYQLPVALGPLIWVEPDLATPGWALVVSSGAATVVPLPDAIDVDPVVDLFLGALSRRDGSDAAVGARLYRALIAPVLGALPEGTDALVVVPDGRMHRLPLALLSEHGEPPLVQRFALSQAPSVSLWHHLRTGDPGAGDGIVALGDPALFAQAPSDDPTRDADWITALRGGLAPLPGGRREAERAVWLLRGDRQAYVGASASESLVEGLDFSSVSVLHLAAHAVTDEAHPERSAVVLASGGLADGLLQVREVAALDLDGELVVLSACSSAGGREMRGEGVFGLARAFFVAGARAVVATLRPMRDADAEALFDRFYAGLARGLPVDRALAAAQRDLARDGLPGEAWATVVVLGDGGWVPYPGGVPGRVAWWWWLVPVPAVIGLLGWLSARGSMR